MIYTRNHYVAGAVIAILAIGIIFYSFKNHDPSSSDSTPSQSASPTISLNPNETPEPTPNVTVQWRGYGVPIGNLHLIGAYRDDLNSFSSPAPDNIPYYDMGTNGSNKIILAVAPALNPGGPVIFFFEKISNGYKFMERMSDSYNHYTAETKQGYELTASITATDTTTYYNALTGPRDVSYKGLHIQQPYRTPSQPFKDYAEELKQQNVTFKKLDTVSDGDLYLRETKTTPQGYNASFLIHSYVLVLPSGLYTPYSIQYSFFSDNYVPAITWTDGSKNMDTYRTDAALGGCGNPGSLVTPSRDISNAIHQTGTTSTGEKIYEFNDSSDPVVQFFYQAGKTHYDPNTGEPKEYTLQEWFSHHPLIVYKNSLGDYALFTNNNYGTNAECGKPVIYLYPEQPQQVLVKVGATIRESVPAYDTGWNVFAKPDGSLNLNGKEYDSLYWEGIGFGMYPAITEGRVVAHENIEITLRSQLTELGLNQKESADFLEFWLPRIPETPYVRLTWFTTQQMNALAPLVVWPQPDTMIRVFLDFAGLEKSISLPAQHLSSIPRTGFTLVEWGGLLRK